MPRRFIRSIVFIGWLPAFCCWAGKPAAADPPAPTIENAAYGPHARNVLDLWQAKSASPTPVIVFIHGGGFVQGDKGGIRRNDLITTCLDAGVSFASINYRFRDTAPIQDILRDAARAIQCLRSRAGEWNIDPARIAAYGSSAGAGTSLWLAFHDDLADPQSDDPVLRQSSRLTAAGSLDGQASYDLRDWEAIVGQSPVAADALPRLQFYGFKSEDEAASPAGDKTMRDCGMIALVSKDDPPVAVACSLPNREAENRREYVHHPKHSIAVAERCRENGVECKLILNEEATRERKNQAREVVEFLLARLKDQPGQ